MTVVKAVPIWCLPVEARPGDEPDHSDAALGGECLVEA